MRHQDRPATGAEKLKIVQGSKPHEPVGTRYAFGEHGCIWTGFATLMFVGAAGATAGGIGENSSTFFGVAAFLIVVGLSCLFVSRIRFGSPSTPDRAVRNYFELIARGNYKAAWAMLVPSEHAGGIGTFEGYEAFRNYWRQTRKAANLRSGKLFFSDVAVHEPIAGVSVCELNLEAAATSIVVPGLFVTGTATLGDGRQYAMRKIAVKFGDEWRMWAPEFMSEDEAEIEWLREV
jgi:hypothetical protein